VEGDIPDLYTVFQPETNAFLETLTPATVVRISHDAIRDAMRSYPALTEAFARQIVADGAVTAEWLTNVGTREGRWCLAHLFCEMAVRLKRVVGNSFSFGFPVCQEKLGEACGLSAVHVNRSLMALRSSGLMHVEGGGVHVRDWKALTTAACFTGEYLASREPVRYLY
jgi:CRP-like cAMP-binding protein